jgi:hypothetical protein
MAEYFNVNIGEVRAHAETVSTIAANVRSVAGGAQDSVSGGAFGELAEFFASTITGAADLVRQTMNSASQTVDQVQTGLGQVADRYQTIEEQHVHAFTVTETGGKTK